MGDESKKAIDELLEIANGQSASLRKLDETRNLFHLRLKKTLSNLPEGEIIEIPSQGFHPMEPIPLPSENRDAEIESPGDLAAQQAKASS